MIDTRRPEIKKKRKESLASLHALATRRNRICAVNPNVQLGAAARPYSNIHVITEDAGDAPDECCAFIVAVALEPKS